MPTVVVDASALAAVLFGEPDADDIRDLIEGRDLTAPRLIRHELVSVAMKKYRLRPDLRAGWAYGLRQYGFFRVVEQPVVAAAVFDLAVDTGLTAYDASYLWLARRLGVPLVTLDGALAAATR